MSESPSVLILPVENQVRELDAKLFLAGIAAARGFRVILGSRAYIHFEIGRLPQGIYIAKSTRAISEWMFRITAGLGHRIVAWEEEALVHPPADTFYSLRLSPETLRRVSDVFCWGADNRDLLSGYQHLPSSTRLHVTGNPRGDLLRPELRSYFQIQVDRYRATYGDFVLINTNFNDVNPYLRAVGLFKNTALSKLGQAGKGMSIDFARGLFHHKRALFNAFLACIENLARALPRQTFVVRPHPSEDRKPYLALSEQYVNLHTIAEGNVLPWLLASKLLVHNGCTTAVEAYALDVPAISYMPVFDNLYDIRFQGFPNQLSWRCDDQRELVGLLEDSRSVVEGQRTEERSRLLSRHIHALDGPFASERILNVLSQTPGGCSPSGARRSAARAQSEIKRAATQIHMGWRPGDNRLGYHDQRFPAVDARELGERLDRLGDVSGRFGALSVDRHSRHVFEIADRT